MSTAPSMTKLIVKYLLNIFSNISKAWPLFYSNVHATVWVSLFLVDKQLLWAKTSRWAKPQRNRTIIFLVSRILQPLWIFPIWFYFPNLRFYIAFSLVKWPNNRFKVKKIIEYKFSKLKPRLCERMRCRHFFPSVQNGGLRSRFGSRYFACFACEYESSYSWGG